MEVLNSILLTIMVIAAITTMIYACVSMYRNDKELRKSIKRCDDIFEKSMEEIRKKYEDKDGE